MRNEQDFRGQEVNMSEQYVMFIRNSDIENAQLKYKIPINQNFNIFNMLTPSVVYFLT